MGTFPAHVAVKMPALSPVSLRRARLLSRRGKLLGDCSVAACQVSPVRARASRGHLRHPARLRAVFITPATTPSFRLPWHNGLRAQTMKAGTISEWHVAEGDELEPGRVIATVETDKASMDWEWQDDGYLAKLLVPGGAEGVEVGRIVAIMVDNEDDIAAFASFSEADLPEQAPEAPEPEPVTYTPAAAAAPAAPPAPAAAAPAPAAATPAAASSAPVPRGGPVAASPLARRIARENGVDISALAGNGTGWEGRIIRADVEEFIASGAAAATATAEAGAALTNDAGAAAPPAAAPATSAAQAGARTGDFFDVPHTDARRRAAALLSESKRQVPHFYLTAEVCLDDLLALRKRLNGSRKQNEQLSTTDLIVKAAAIASRRVPEANSSWLPHAVRSYSYVDVAVSTNTEAGIVTPVVRDAHAKGAADISSDLRRLTASARDGTLTRDDASGATITITNLGAYGLRQASPIINPPQAAHLAIGAATRRCVPGDGEEAWKASVYFNATLSCDHRVLDGAVGAQWLSVFKSLLEDPATMLL